MADPLALLLFALLTAFAVAASLHSWRTRQAYGWFRCLAFESLAVLVPWNLGRWFDDPTSLKQTISWVLFVVATVLTVHGIHLLRRVGGARRRIMEDTHAVVEVGAYRYIRHPLYAALMLFGWGVFLKGTDLVSAVLAVAATVFLYLTARHEERHNVARFGAAYSDYMSRTKMFIPFMW